MNMSLTAVIPVKKNSSRLPGKNFLPIGIYDSLLENKIEQLKKVKKIDRILVTSDSKKAQIISEKCGVDFQLRPEEFANESRPLSEFFRYVGDLLKTEHMLWACVTSPVINESDYNNAIELYNQYVLEGNHDSLITVSEFQHYLMTDRAPLNYELGENHKNSDQLDNLFLFTNGILICNKKKLIKWGYNYGPKAYRMIIPQEKSIDIDTKWDYLTAKIWMEELKK